MTQTMRERLVMAINKLAGVEGIAPEGVNLFGRGINGDMIVDAILAELLTPDARMRDVGVQAASPVTLGPAGAQRVFASMIDHVRGGK